MSFSIRILRMSTRPHAVANCHLGSLKPIARIHGHEPEPVHGPIKLPIRSHFLIQQSTWRSTRNNRQINSGNIPSSISLHVYQHFFALPMPYATIAFPSIVSPVSPTSPALFAISIIAPFVTPIIIFSITDILTHGAHLHSSTLWSVRFIAMTPPTSIKRH